MFAEGAQHAAGLAIELARAAPGLGGGVDHLAIDIELELIARAVSHPHRARAAVTGQFHYVLIGRNVAVDIVEDAQAGPRQPRRVQEPADEPAGLLVIAEAEQRASATRSAG